MNSDTPNPRDIPILTDAVNLERMPPSSPINTKALQSAILADTTKLADSLLQQAAKDIEAILYERVLDRLRAELPELVDRVIREHVSAHADLAGDEHG